MSLLGFRLAARPADAGHPYGHGRFEYLAGLSVAVIVCSVGLNLVTESVNKLLHPSFTEYGVASMAVLILSMVVKTWMALFNRRLGHRIDSGTLLATAVDSRNDVIASGAVLAAVLISRATGIDLDGWAGLAWAFLCVPVASIWCATRRALFWARLQTRGLLSASTPRSCRIPGPGHA